MNSTKIALLKRLLPVVLPVFLLVSVTGALRLATAIRDGIAASKAPASSRGIATVFNPTEATFLQISQISDVIDRGDDATALAMLHSLRDMPLSTDGNTFHNAALKNFSPLTYLMGIGFKLSAHAQSLRQSGQNAVAYEYIQAVYSIGDNILASKTPTIKGLRLVHFYHGLASRTEGQFYAPNSLLSAISESQHLALQMLWEHQIIPQLSNHPDSVVASKEEQTVASRLFLQYRNQWVRIRTNEV